MDYWLMKSEPDVFGINDLNRQKRAVWDGVRNYQARNFLRAMKLGDLVFFYHSNTDVPGIVGLCRVSKTGVVDPTQFDHKSRYYDPGSSKDNPRWWTVEVEYLKTFPKQIPLSTLRAKFSPAELRLVQKANRLSVMPVAAAVAKKILALAK